MQLQPATIWHAPYLALHCRAYSFNVHTFVHKVVDCESATTSDDNFVHLATHAAACVIIFSQLDLHLPLPVLLVVWENNSCENNC